MRMMRRMESVKNVIGGIQRIAKVYAIGVVDQGISLRTVMRTCQLRSNAKFASDLPTWLMLP